VKPSSMTAAACVTTSARCMLPVNVDVLNAAGEKVFAAQINMWLSPSPKR